MNMKRIMILYMLVLLIFSCKTTNAELLLVHQTPVWHEAGSSGMWVYDFQNYYIDTNTIKKNPPVYDVVVIETDICLHKPEFHQGERKYHFYLGHYSNKGEHRKILSKIKKVRAGNYDVMYDKISIIKKSGAEPIDGAIIDGGIALLTGTGAEAVYNAILKYNK